VHDLSRGLEVVLEVLPGDVVGKIANIDRETAGRGVHEAGWALSQGGVGEAARRAVHQNLVSRGWLSVLTHEDGTALQVRVVQGPYGVVLVALVGEDDEPTAL